MTNSNQSIFTIYTDIPGHKMNGRTTPPDVLVTDSRPYIVMLDRKSRVINIFELTCSFAKKNSAHQKKTTKYIDLKKDLVKAGWTTNLEPFKIGSRGQVTMNSNNIIRDMMKLVNINTQHKKLISELSHISLLASFSISHARCQRYWESPPPSSNHRQPTCTAALWRNLPARGLDLCYNLIFLSFILSRPGRSQGLLYKHLRYSLIHWSIL